MTIQRQNAPMHPLEAYSHKPRSCDELGLCQNRKPPCAGCTCDDTSPLGHGVYNFAPGIIEGGPVKPSMLRRWGLRNVARWVGVGCLAATVLASCAYNVGYLSVALWGGL